MEKMSRARLRDSLYYVERHIAAGAEQIERQREAVARMEAASQGESTVAPARALLATMEAAQRGHIADRERIKRLLASRTPTAAAHRRARRTVSKTLA